MSKKKNPAAVSLGRKGGEARRKALTPEQRSASARHAVLSRYGKAEPPSRWYGLYALDDPNFPELVMYSRDRVELRQRARAEDRAFVIEELDYDPQTRVPIVPKYEPDTDSRLQALRDLQKLDVDAGKRGRS